MNWELVIALSLLTAIIMFVAYAVTHPDSDSKKR